MIGGPPCQLFSSLHRTPTDAQNLIPEFERVVYETKASWFVMENVPAAPLPVVSGFGSTSHLFQNRWLGEEQSRMRRFTLGWRQGLVAKPAAFFAEISKEFAVFENPIKSGCFTANGTQWEPGVDNGNRKGRSRSCRTDAEFRRGCRLQGLPDTFLEKSPFTVEGKIRLVGNGVPLPMGQAVARAVKRVLASAGRAA